MRLFAVFGNPIAHSKSPLLHNYVFYKLGVDARYSRYLLENSNSFREIFFHLGLSGANITLPFKESLLDSCDEVRGIAKKIGAINTIIREDERLIGYNTDAIGFFKNIESFGVKTALIIGAGGSARALAMILAQNGVQTSILNRSEKRLEFFRQNGFECFSAAQIEPLFGRNFDIVINSTSASIDGILPLDRENLSAIFANSRVAFDLMYGKECEFLNLAQKHGLEVKDGAEMLLYQGIYANKLFLDVCELDSRKIGGKISYEMIEKNMREIFN